MATTNLGRVGLAPRGAYDENTAYVKYDVVAYNGAAYVVIANSVTGSKHLAEDIRMFANILSHHKKSGFDVILRQDRQHLWCYFRNRSVIEGEIHRLTHTENAVRVETL